MAVVGILLVGAAMRAVYLGEMVHAPDFDSPRQDPSVHDYWARSIVSGDWTPPKGECDPQIRTTVYFRPPGYPYFLAGVYWLTGSSYVGARVVQFSLGLVNCLLLYLLLRRVIGRPVALIATAMCATYWVFIYSEGELNEQVVLIFLMLALFHFLYQWRVHPLLRWAFLSGIVMGAYALIRPNVFLFTGGVVCWMAWLLLREVPLRPFGRFSRKLIPSVVALSIGMMILIIPVTVRNYLVAQDAVLISSYFGENLLIGNGEDSDACTPWTPYLQKLEGTGRWSVYVYVNVVAGLARELGIPNIKHSAVSTYFTHKAVDYMLAHKWRTVKLWVKKALLFWGPKEVTCNKVVEFEKQQYPLLHYLPGFPWVMGLFLLGTGLFCVDIRRRVVAPITYQFIALAFIYILLYFGSYLPFFTTGRYRVPLIPFMLILAGYGVWRIVENMRTKQWRRGVVQSVIGAGLIGVCSINVAGYKPDLTRWYYERALAHEARERWEPAIGELRAYLKLRPDNVELHNALGLMLVRVGRPEEAMAEYAEALRLDPEYAMGHNNLGFEYYKKGRIEEARTEYETALRLNPELALTHNNLGNLLVDLKQYAEAQEHFMRVVAIEPRDKNGYFNLANLMARQNRFKESLAYYKKAAENDPRNPIIFNDWAIALARLNQLEESVKLYAEAIRVHPAYVDARINRGVVLEALGKVEEAKAEYQQVLASFPTNARARERLNLLQNNQRK